MPNADFFEQFGLFAVKNFLDRDFCLSLCHEMGDAPFRSGTFVSPHTGEEILNEDVKKRSEVTKLAKNFRETVSEKLMNLKSTLDNVTPKNVIPLFFYRLKKRKVL